MQHARICKAKTKSETERETVNWDWVAWQQRSKQREEGGRGRRESAGIPHNSADKGALLLLINFIAEIRQCCTLYKHTHTHTTRTQQLYKGNYLRVLQTAQLFPLFHCVCVCFSVRNFHAKSNAILGKSFSKNTKSSSADDPHVIHQRQCLSAKLTIQSRQLRRQRRRRLQSQQQRR